MPENETNLAGSFIGLDHQYDLLNCTIMNV